MRGRLDGSGNRLGEIIKYRDSELRFVEMFETLCDDLKVVALSNLTEGGPKEWVKKSDKVPVNTAADAYLLYLASVLPFAAQCTSPANPRTI
eukprot:6002395-Pyramimonas_sp.AAC.1